MERTAPRPALLVLDSITVLPADCAGAVVLAASHGGAYCGQLAAKAGLGGVILHDAGLGRDNAGIAALPLLERIGMPAAAVDFRSARIGDGADCHARGTLSTVNGPAALLGLRVGMGAAEALARLDAAPRAPLDRRDPLPVAAESRRLWREAPPRAPIWLLDSNALVRPEDAGAIVITGSHGGLPGGRAETAIRAPVFAAAYNDAGIGADGAGISRLPALEARGIAGITVSAASARIGDALSTLEDGRVSHVNPTAARHGAEPGQTMRECVTRLEKARRASSQNQRGEDE